MDWGGLLSRSRHFSSKQKKQRGPKVPAAFEKENCSLGADALLQVEFDHTETLLVCGERSIEVQAQALRSVGRHDYAVVQLDGLGRSRVVRIGIHAKSQVNFVNVRRDADDIRVARLDASGFDLDLRLLGLGRLLGFFAHEYWKRWRPISERANACNRFSRKLRWS